MYSCLDCNELEVERAEGPRSTLAHLLVQRAAAKRHQSGAIERDDAQALGPAHRRHKGGDEVGQGAHVSLHLSIHLSKDPARKLCTAARVT